MRRQAFRRYPDAMLLSATEARVLGSLIEKEITTPDQYPLSLNSLVSACNQKTSREPVLQLSDRDVQGALRSLEDQDLVSTDHGSRVERYENRARTVFQLRRDETALLCLLLLRGPQTPGELRGRAERLFIFDDISSVIAALDRMSRPGGETGSRERLVEGLQKQAGSREQRYRQLLTETAPQTTTHEERNVPEAGERRPAGAANDAASENDKVERQNELEARVLSLEERLSRLEERFTA